MAAVAQIIITIDESGSISVAAPFVNKMLCYGMLEMARDVIRIESEAAKDRKVQPATFGDLAQLGNGKGS